MAEQKSSSAPSDSDSRRTPQSLISEAHVKAALRCDKGSEALLTSWTVKDFTKKGDNYACFVTSIEVNYSVSGKDQQVSYVVKLNPCRQAETLNNFAKSVFEKESGFYEKIAPLLNAELEAVGEAPLKIPKCFATVKEKGSEVIVLEDLRPAGFKMFERMKGMDKAHTTLVVRELGRLHAASLYCLKKLPYKLEEKYPFLVQDFTSFNKDSTTDFNDIFAGYVHNAADMAERIGGYEKTVNWLRNAAPDAVNMFEEQIKSKPPFEVICHGDCWNNNVLFRYNAQGVPVDVRLVDLQLCRLSSPGTDLNYLLFTSLNGSDRRNNLDAFLASYYDSLSSIMRSGGEEAPFTHEELKKEFHARNLFGLLMAVMVVPIVVSEATEIMDLDSMKSDDIELFMKEQRERTLRQLDNNRLLRPRLLSVFEDMVHYGVM